MQYDPQKDYTYWVVDSLGSPTNKIVWTPGQNPAVRTLKLIVQSVSAYYFWQWVRTPAKFVRLRGCGHLTKCLQIGAKVFYFVPWWPAIKQSTVRPCVDEKGLKHCVKRTDTLFNNDGVFMFDSFIDWRWIKLGDLLVVVGQCMLSDLDPWAKQRRNKPTQSWPHITELTVFQCWQENL